MEQRPWQYGTPDELVTQVESVGKVAPWLNSIESGGAGTSESGGATRCRIYGCTEEEFALGQEMRRELETTRGVVCFVRQLPSHAAFYAAKRR